MGLLDRIRGAGERPGTPTQSSVTVRATPARSDTDAALSPARGDAWTLPGLKTTTRPMHRIIQPPSSMLVTRRPTTVVKPEVRHGVDLRVSGEVLSGVTARATGQTPPSPTSVRRKRKPSAPDMSALDSIVDDEPTSTGPSFGSGSKPAAAKPRAAQPSSAPAPATVTPKPSTSRPVGQMPSISDVRSGVMLRPVEPPKPKRPAPVPAPSLDGPTPENPRVSRRMNWNDLVPSIEPEAEPTPEPSPARRRGNAPPRALDAPSTPSPAPTPAAAPAPAAPPAASAVPPPVAEAWPGTPVVSPTAGRANKLPDLSAFGVIPGVTTGPGALTSPSLPTPPAPTQAPRPVDVAPKAAPALRARRSRSALNPDTPASTDSSTNGPGSTPATSAPQLRSRDTEPATPVTPAQAPSSTAPTQPSTQPSTQKPTAATPATSAPQLRSRDADPVMPDAPERPDLITHTTPSQQTSTSTSTSTTSAQAPSSTAPTQPSTQPSTQKPTAATPATSAPQLRSRDADPVLPDAPERPDLITHTTNGKQTSIPATPATSSTPTPAQTPAAATPATSAPQLRSRDADPVLPAVPSRPASPAAGVTNSTNATNAAHTPDDGHDHGPTSTSTSSSTRPVSSADPLLRARDAESAPAATSATVQSVADPSRPDLITHTNATATSAPQLRAHDSSSAPPGIAPDGETPNTSSRVNLSSDIRSSIEREMGSSPASIEVRQGPAADRRAREFNAEAFTDGGVVHLAADRPLSSARGRQLLAHEATHVVQQSSGNTSPRDHLEHQARRVESHAGGPPAPARPTFTAPPAGASSASTATAPALSTRSTPAAATSTNSARVTAPAASPRRTPTLNGSRNAAAPKSSGKPAVAPSSAFADGNRVTVPNAQANEPSDLKVAQQPSVVAAAVATQVAREAVGMDTASSGPLLRRREGEGHQHHNDVSEHRMHRGESSQSHSTSQPHQSSSHSQDTRSSTHESRVGGGHDDEFAEEEPDCNCSGRNHDTAHDRRWLETHAHALYPFIRGEIRSELLRDRERRGRLMREQQ